MIKEERLKALIKKALADVFLKLGYTKIIFETMIMSSDFKHLNIEISSYGDQSTEFWVKKLNKNISIIVKKLHEYINLNNFPKIRFSQDRHEVRIKRICSIIAENK